MSAPLTGCDVHFLGMPRRCETCNRPTPMFWIPEPFWLKFIPIALRKKHVCFECFLTYVRVDPRSLLP